MCFFKCNLYDLCHFDNMISSGSDSLGCKDRGEGEVAGTTYQTPDSVPGAKRELLIISGKCHFPDLFSPSSSCP